MGEGLSPREHDEMRDLVLAGTQRIRPAGAHRAQFVAMGVSLVLVGAVAGGIVTSALRDEGAPEPVAPPSPSPTASAPEGWVAYSSGFSENDIYVVKAGSAPHRVVGSDDDTLDQVCPAFSPDGARIASGQSEGNEQSGWQDAAVVITEVTEEGEPGASEAIPLDGPRSPPCPIWSPDGRWIAFGTEYRPDGTWGVAGEVWVVDTETREIRRLTKLVATDIEWAVDGSQLYIADEDGILIYSIPDAETRTISDTAGAVALTASPDGTTLAVEQRRTDSAERYDLWLMSDAGTDRRVLVEDYAHDRGIGPVWSPDGNRVVFQRSNGASTRSSGEIGILGENEEVVIVTVTDDDPFGPVGTQAVLATNTTEGGREPRRWFPVTVSWAPDSASLRFVGWELRASGEMGAGSGLLTVPADSTVAPTILWETPEGIGAMSVFPQNDFQSWSSR